MTPPTLVLVALGAWLLISVVVALVIGQAIGLRDRAERPSDKVGAVVQAPKAAVRHRAAARNAQELTNALGGGRVREG
jgi:hypothetical protein